MSLNPVTQHNISWKVADFKDRECVVCYGKEKEYLYHPTIRSDNTVSNDVLHMLCLKCVKGIFSRPENEILHCPQCRYVYPIEMEKIKNRDWIWKMPPQYWVVPSSYEILPAALNFLFRSRKKTILINLIKFIKYKDKDRKTILRNNNIVNAIDSIAKQSGTLGYLSIIKTITKCCSKVGLGYCLTEAAANNHKNCALFLLDNYWKRIPNNSLHDALNSSLAKENFMVNFSLNNAIRTKKWLQPNIRSLT